MSYFEITAFLPYLHSMVVYGMVFRGPLGLITDTWAYIICGRKLCSISIDLLKVKQIRNIIARSTLIKTRLKILGQT